MRDCFGIKRSKSMELKVLNFPNLPNWNIYCNLCRRVFDKLVFVYKKSLKTIHLITHFRL